MATGTQPPQEFPRIAPEDLANLGVESQLLPSISTTFRARQPPNGSPPLGPVEVESLVENLDKIVSSATANQSLRNKCFRVLRKVSSAHGVLPKSYFPAGVTLSDVMPHSSEGGSADIWKGQQDGNEVCIKAFRAQRAGNLGEMKRRFYRDIVGWKYVSHPNVVPFLGVSETLFSFSIISPWLPNGNIAEYVQNYKDADRLQLLWQATCGLEHLHSLGIVHSNVTPGNILITEEGDARLGDFGITGVIRDPTVGDRDSRTPSKPGATRYMAPELLEPQQLGHTESNPSKESDVYSFAMTAYQVLSGTVPYGIQSEAITAFNIVSGSRPPRPDDPTAKRWLTDPIWDVIRYCWDQNPQSRLPTDSLCQAFVSPVPKQERDTLVVGDGGATTGVCGMAVLLPKLLPPEEEQSPTEPLDEHPPPVKRNLFKKALARIRDMVRRVFCRG